MPEASSTQSLNLNAGLAVAKRAGAGKLVMGDVLKLGSRTTVTAKVFDVRNGQRLRSVREETSVQDSVMSLYGKLARRILNVAPPQGANVGGLGTTRVDAYQEYVAGVEALNKFELNEARRRLGQALKLDSAFALAHYKMAITIGWEGSGDPALRQHAQAANRWSAGLPARERALITGQMQQSSGAPDAWTKACETYGALVKADSSDVEAWYGLGDCLFHDPSIEAVNGDTTNLRFRADWNRSVRAFEHVLQLDPTYHLAYQHIIDALTAERHGTGCYRADATARCAFYSAFLLRSGDSLLAMPVPVADTAKLHAQAEHYVQSRTRRRNLQVAHTVASAWVQAAPEESRAQATLAHVLLLQGRTAEAGAQLSRVTDAGSLHEQLRRLLARMEIAYKLGRGGEAIRIYDSIRTATIPLPGAPFQFGNVISGYGPAFGRLTKFDSLLAANVRAQNMPDHFVRYIRYSLRSALTGTPHDSTTSVERETFDQISAANGPSMATRRISATLMYSLRAARPSWPAIDTTVRDPKLRPAVAVMSGDTARLRAAARALDSLLSITIAAGGTDSAYAVVAADAFLILRDSAAALRVLRASLDSATATTAYFPQTSGQGPPVYFVPRAMLLRADLAAAAGQRDEARAWYTRFIDMWSTAVPEFQPIVERARKSLAALGSS